MKNANRKILGGFTLIELLVVVLIIGILASVALPQYKRAVEKSKMMKYLPSFKAVVEAGQVYLLANPPTGNGWMSTENFDIAPGVTEMEIDGVKQGIGFFVVNLGNDNPVKSFSRYNNHHEVYGYTNTGVYFCATNYKYLCANRGFTKESSLTLADFGGYVWGSTIYEMP